MQRWQSSLKVAPYGDTEKPHLMYPSQAFKAFLLSLSDYELNQITEPASAEDQETAIDQVMKGKGLNSGKESSVKSNLKKLMMGTHISAEKTKAEFLKDFRSFLKKSVTGSFLNPRASGFKSHSRGMGTRRSHRLGARSGKDKLYMSRSVVNLSDLSNDDQMISSRQKRGGSRNRDVSEEMQMILQNQKPRSSLYQVQQNREGGLVVTMN
jgi:hypothetical protein